MVRGPIGVHKAPPKGKRSGGGGEHCRSVLHGSLLLVLSPKTVSSGLRDFRKSIVKQKVTSLGIEESTLQG